MAKSSKPKRVSASFKLRADILAKFREHVRNEAGRPLFRTQTSLLESAIEREIERDLRILESQDPRPAVAQPTHRTAVTVETTRLNNRRVHR